MPQQRRKIGRMRPEHDRNGMPRDLNRSRNRGMKQRPTEMPELQAAAAVGQSRLMQHWEHAFGAHSTEIGQVLLTHDDLGDRRRFLSARLTLRALLDHGCVPIINENDTVATEEIKFGDNDQLAALVVNLISADALVILTDVEGVRDATGVRMPIVRDIEREAAPVAGGSTSARTLKRSYRRSKPMLMAS